MASIFTSRLGHNPAYKEEHRSAQRLQSKHQAIAIDLHQGGLSTSLTHLSPEAWPTLAPPSKFISSALSPRSTFYPGASLANLNEILDTQLAKSEEQDLPIIFGLTEDPFLPFEGKFDHSLKIIEALAKRSPRALCIQTRSPLVVLCCPILKSLNSRALVSLHLETRSDKIANRLFSGLPRPSERLQAARALKNLGLGVQIVCSPPEYERGLKRYADLLSAAANWFQIQEASSPNPARSLLRKYLEELRPRNLNCVPPVFYKQETLPEQASSAA